MVPSIDRVRRRWWLLGWWMWGSRGGLLSMSWWLLWLKQHLKKFSSCCLDSSNSSFIRFIMLSDLSFSMVFFRRSCVALRISSFLAFLFGIGVNWFVVAGFLLGVSSEVDSPSLGRADGSTAWSGWHESLVFTSAKSWLNQLPKPFESWNLLIPVAVFIVRAAFCTQKQHFLNLFLNCGIVASKSSPR